MTTERLKIEGMTCQNCVRHVKTALEGVDGVDTAEVSLEAGLAVVEGRRRRGANGDAGGRRGRRLQGRRRLRPMTVHGGPPALENAAAARRRDDLRRLRGPRRAGAARRIGRRLGECQPRRRVRHGRRRPPTSRSTTCAPRVEAAGYGLFEPSDDTDATQNAARALRTQLARAAAAGAAGLFLLLAGFDVLPGIDGLGPPDPLLPHVRRGRPRALPRRRAPSTRRPGTPPATAPST